MVLKSFGKLLFLNFFLYSLDDFGQIIVYLHLVLDFFAGVQDGGIVFAAEKLTDLRQGIIRHLSDEIHRYLSWKSDVVCLLGRFDVGQLDAVMAANGFFNFFRRDRPFNVAEYIF